MVYFERKGRKGFFYKYGGGGGGGITLVLEIFGEGEEGGEGFFWKFGKKKIGYQVSNSVDLMNQIVRFTMRFFKIVLWKLILRGWLH